MNKDKQTTVSYGVNWHDRARFEAIAKARRKATGEDVRWTKCVQEAFAMYFEAQE